MDFHYGLERKKAMCALGIVLSCTVLIGASMPAVYAWRLTVDLSQSSFGDDQVCASVEGGYGYGPVNQCTNAGRNAQVTFNIGNRIEAGENYEVCAWSGVVGAIFSNCENDTADGDDKFLSGLQVAS
jgi:hypothetical protein